MSGESRIDVSIVTVVYVVSDHVPPAKTKACSAFLPFEEPWLFSRVTCSHVGFADSVPPGGSSHRCRPGLRRPLLHRTIRTQLTSANLSEPMPLLGKVPPSCWHLTAEPP